MSGHLIIAYVTFAMVGAFTPGPNNMMLMTSGLNYGLRRTLPHILGVGFGYALVIVICGLGLGALFTRYPLLYTLLKYAGAAYLLWLAFLIARAGPVEPGEDARGRPLTFFGAALYQWVNLKGLVVAVSAVTAYAGVAPYPINIAVLAGIFLLVGLSSAASWALFGTSLRSLLRSPHLVRVFNVAMALALVLSLYPVLREG